MEISASTGSRKELFAAEMHLKSILRQARTVLGFLIECFVTELARLLRKPFTASSICEMCLPVLLHATFPCASDL